MGAPRSDGRRGEWPTTSLAKVTGFVMVEQVKSIDFRTRKAKRIGKAPSSVLDEVLSILDACIY
ncbi:MAG: type II toxin-antitoxin system PemK/MazF family toxin [Gemmatimonadales bacterium]